MFDTMFANLFRSNALYANPDSTKYSVVKINDTYRHFSEGMHLQFPGYGLDRKWLVVNETDATIDYD